MPDFIGIVIESSYNIQFRSLTHKIRSNSPAEISHSHYGNIISFLRIENTTDYFNQFFHIIAFFLTAGIAHKHDVPAHLHGSDVMHISQLMGINVRSSLVKAIEQG